MPTVVVDEWNVAHDEGAAMSRDERTPGRRADGWMTWSLLAFAAGLLLVAPGTAAAGGGRGSGSDVAAMSTDDQMIAEASRLDQKFVELYNARKWDELGAVYYAEDAIAAPPNHEPIQGRAAIVDFYRAGRDTFGELEGGTETWRASSSGKLVSLVGKFSAYSGHVRVTSHGLFERQPDGSLKCTVDMFGFRDPAM